MVYPAPELRKSIIKKEGVEHEFDIDALRDDWYKTSYLLDRKQSMNGMAKKRYTNYKKQPIEMNFGYGFKGTLASYSLDANRRKPSGIKAAIIREKGTNGEREMAYSMYLAGLAVCGYLFSSTVNEALQWQISTYQH